MYSGKYNVITKIVLIKGLRVVHANLSQPQASGTLHLLVAWKVELVKLTEHEGLTIIHN
jgi:hypothetical protein